MTLRCVPRNSMVRNGASRRSLLVKLTLEWFNTSVMNSGGERVCTVYLLCETK